jgi:hypothetical protein
VKNPYYLLALGLLGASCQQRTPPAATTAAAAPANSAAQAGPVAKSTTPALPVTLSPEVLAMLRQVDLAPLLLYDFYPDTEIRPMEGFYGPDHYRLSLVLTRVQRDSLQPNVFHVQGKTRYKKAVEEVTGDITVAQFGDYYDQEILASRAVDSLGNAPAARAYSALLNVTLSSQQQHTRRLQGVGALDFYIDELGKMEKVSSPDGVSASPNAPGKGAGLLLRGEWLNGPAGTNRSFVLSRNIFISADGLFKDFGVGDRGGEINPKYAKLGWDKYWENDEWWADAQKPALSL